MSVIERIGRALVIAPHPDDEVLGCGGTIARLAASGREVHVGIATEGRPPLYSSETVARVRGEAEAAHRLLGVASTRFLTLPAAGLDAIPQTDINQALHQLIAEVAPDTLFLPFAGDIHVDHQLIFASAMVAVRPLGRDFPRRIFAFETLSETNWGAPGVKPRFDPNLFIGIEETLDRKLEAFRLYASQMKPFPHERSIDAISALARLRGATVHLRAAEAFVTVREVG